MKPKLFYILGAVFNIQNNAYMLRKMILGKGNNFVKFRNIAKKRRFPLSKFWTSEKDILNYITTRNMRKTFTYSNENFTQDFRKLYSENNLKLKELIDLFKCHPPIPVTHTLNFHIKTGLQGSLASKQTDGKAAEKEELEEHWGGSEAFKLITFIKNDFDEVLKRHESLIVFFSAYWCPHCSRLKKPFGMAALMAKEANLPISFATFDVTTNPDVADEKGVVGIPIIKYYKSGKFVATFKGKRTADDLLQFAKNPPERSSTSKTADV